MGKFLISCVRGFERDAASEAWWVLSSLLKNKTIDADLTEVPGLVFIIVDADPRRIIGCLREFLRKNLDELRYCLKFIPLQDWCKTDLNLICMKVTEKSNEISNADRWCIVLNKRYNSLKRDDIIKQVALRIPHGKVDLKNPNKIIQIEIVGKNTGISILQPDQIISIEKLRRNRRNVSL
ncbi:MAG: THUMP domain-containing protein [Candidatus Heimdallarchaeota archaeon]